MTMPEQKTDGIQAQVLIKLGEIGTDVAVIKAQMVVIPELQKRVRDLELAQAETNGQRDWWARAIAGLAVLAAVANVIAYFVPRHP